MEPIGELRFHRLLVAIDGSKSSELALAAAVTVARRDNAALTLISVDPDVVAEADSAAERALRDAADRVPQDIPVTRVVRRGKAGPAIIAAAAEEPYDAILMGARGVGRIESMMGSVSSYVLHHADTAVFVAHAPRDTADEPDVAPAA
jgi:nucleotide-binding universal stress UspA family protein